MPKKKTHVRRGAAPTVSGIVLEGPFGPDFFAGLLQAGSRPASSTGEALTGARLGLVEATIIRLETRILDLACALRRREAGKATQFATLADEMNKTARENSALHAKIVEYEDERVSASALRMKADKAAQEQAQRHDLFVKRVNTYVGAMHATLVARDCKLGELRYELEARKEDEHDAASWAAERDRLHCEISELGDMVRQEEQARKCNDTALRAEIQDLKARLRRHTPLSVMTHRHRTRCVQNAFHVWKLDYVEFARDLTLAVDAVLEATWYACHVMLGLEATRWDMAETTWPKGSPDVHASVRLFRV